MKDILDKLNDVKGNVDKLYSEVIESIHIANQEFEKVIDEIAEAYDPDYLLNGDEVYLHPTFYPTKKTAHKGTSNADMIEVGANDICTIIDCGDEYEVLSAMLGDDEILVDRDLVRRRVLGAYRQGMKVRIRSGKYYMTEYVNGCTYEEEGHQVIKADEMFDFPIKTGTLESWNGYQWVVKTLTEKIEVPPEAIIGEVLR